MDVGKGSLAFDLAAACGLVKYRNTETGGNFICFVLKGFRHYSDALMNASNYTLNVWPLECAINAGRMQEMDEENRLQLRASSSSDVLGLAAEQLF